MGGVLCVCVCVCGQVHSKLAGQVHSKLAGPLYKPCSRLSKLSVALDKFPNLSVRESSHHLGDHSLFHGNGCGNGWGFVSPPCRRRCFPTSLNNRLCVCSSTVFAVILHNVHVRTLRLLLRYMYMHNEY